MLSMINENPTFLSRVLFSDEANFCNNGQVNRHNMHYWVMENPYWMRTVSFQRPWFLNVWYGIVSNHRITFFWRIFKWRSIRRFSRKHTPAIIKERTTRFTYKHVDATPAHFARIFRLKRDFSSEVDRTRRYNTLTCPFSRFRLDYFLWDFIKSRVMAIAPMTRNRIGQACSEITIEQLIKVRQSFQRRLRLCLQQEGKHFEHLLN